MQFIAQEIKKDGKYRAAVRIVQSGAIGKISEVHSWSNKTWGDTALMPDRSDPVPPSLDWDLWLGVATRRPYIEGFYHPVNWRKRIDFGTATFGDMGCHILDPVLARWDSRRLCGCGRKAPHRDSTVGASTMSSTMSSPELRTPKATRWR